MAEYNRISTEIEIKGKVSGVDPEKKLKDTNEAAKQTAQSAIELANKTSKANIAFNKLTGEGSKLAKMLNSNKADIGKVASSMERIQKLQSKYDSLISPASISPANTMSPEQATNLARQATTLDLLQKKAELAAETYSKLVNEGASPSKQTTAFERLTKAVQRYDNALNEAVHSKTQLEETPTVTETSPANTISGSAWDEVASTFAGGRLDIFKSAVREVADDIERLGKSALVAGKNIVSGFMNEIGNKAVSKVKNFTKSLSSVIGAFKRIMFYRMVRTVIKDIGQAFGEGIKNLYQWSKLANGEFSQSMDRIATAGLYMKNSLGAMVAPIINTLAPAVDYLVDRFVDLLNVINKVLAVLGGATSWTKAIKYPKEYAEAANGAAGAAKKLGLAGIDQLTILSKGSGSGGGSSGTDYSSMFETVDLGGGIWDRIREAIENGDWRGAGQILAEKLNEIVANLDTRAWGHKLGTAINNGIEFAYGFLKFTDFQQIGGKIANFINGGLETINWNTAGRLVTRGITAIYDTVIGFVTTLDWGLVARSISDYIIGRFDEFTEWIEGIDWNNLGYQLGMSIGEAIANVKWNELADSVINFFTSAVDAALGLGVGILMPISSVEFEDTSNWGWKDWARSIISAIAPAAGAVLGFMVGGPGGAAIGLTIGLGLSFKLKNNVVEDAEGIGMSLDKTTSKYMERIRKNAISTNKTVDDDTAEKLRSILSNYDVTWGKIDTGVSFDLWSLARTIAENGKIIKESTDYDWNKIKETISTKVATAKTNATEKFDQLATSVQTKWSNLKKNAETTWSGIKSTIEGWVNKIKNLLNFNWSLPSIKIPHFRTTGSFGWSWSGGVTLPQIYVDWYAKGGFPDAGQLFIANEAGAEMVGSMDGHTAVANNQQIVEGIREGVYDAMVSALGDGRLKANVYLDGKQISGTVVQNVNSETRRTGRSPLLSY